jgi:hypothetical protein
VREEVLDVLGRLDPRAVRHPDVHQDHVGHGLLGLLDSLVAVARFPDDLDVLLLLEDHLEAPSEEGVIVHDENLQPLKVVSGCRFLRHGPLRS